MIGLLAVLLFIAIALMVLIGVALDLREKVDTLIMETRDTNLSINNLRLKSRTKIGQANVVTGPKIEGAELARMPSAAGTVRRVVGGDADSGLNQRLERQGASDGGDTSDD